MYMSPVFKNEDREAIFDFIENNGFGILVSSSNPRILATHIPFDLYKNQDGQMYLQGHVAKGNPQWKEFATQSEVLVIFNGPHSYISSSWYDHENVPTWNYIAVHVYGKINILSGEPLLSSLKKMVDKYEKGSKNPVSVSTMSESFLKKQINGIVGFEIEITELQAAYKLSQNRDAKNQQAIVDALNETNDTQAKAIAAAMEKQQKK